MIRLIAVVIVTMLTSYGVSGDLAFGPDHLHLSFKDGWYKVDSQFVDNTRCKKKIRYVKVTIDEKMMKVTDSLFYDPPSRLYQSACAPEIAIAINNGNRQFPSQVVLFRDGKIDNLVEIPLGQGPAEMTQVGNAMLINNDKLVVYGMRKLLAYDLSKDKPIPIASTVLKRAASTSHTRMGQYRDGFVLVNDMLAKTSVGKAYYFSIYTLKNHDFLFIRTGNPDYPQGEILLKEPLAEYAKFMKTGKSSFVNNILSNGIADGFGEFETYLLDFSNHALLLLSTKENRILRYTTFDKDAFVHFWFQGDNYFCIPHFDDIKTNFFGHSVWLLNHPKMDAKQKLLPASKNGRILTDNLQEIDVLDANLKYVETIRFVPPKKYARFYIKTIAITGEKEVTAVIQIATEEELKTGNGGSYLTRLILQ